MLNDYERDEYSHCAGLPEHLRRPIHVSSQKSFIADVSEEYDTDDEVSIEVDVVTDLFKKRNDYELRNRYNDHELTGMLSGYRSLHLFADRDVVIVYKRSRNGHISFYRIGSHSKVYDRDYEKFDKERQMKSRYKGPPDMFMF